ncbi:FixH family protein [Jannaschia formosa]|uniref:FixH family protein n=1 Tax=Jannaschia formosa TaxID=2259592 RepID=UPI000E1BE47A|nr:FixH family protein [Jannaschia formosa]TFL16560.1 Auxin-binding protein [Jannaschia formosa]
MPYFPTRRAILFGIPVLVLATGVAAGFFSRSVPSDLDLAMSKATASGLYLAALAPVTEPVTVGPMHSWTVSLTDAAGAPIEAASISVDGGMPQHGHGLPTAPAVTRSIGKGQFLIEGMKFNMSGWWVIDLSIDSAAGADTVTFNLML